MSDSQSTLQTLNYYKALFAAFQKFFAAAQKALPAGNEYGIVFQACEGPVIRMSVLGHACRGRFSILLDSELMPVGRIFFERMVSAETAERFLVLHFDDQLSAQEAGLLRPAWLNLDGGEQLTKEFPVLLLDHFFVLLSSEKSPHTN